MDAKYWWFAGISWNNICLYVRLASILITTELETNVRESNSTCIIMSYRCPSISFWILIPIQDDIRFYYTGITPIFIYKKNTPFFWIGKMEVDIYKKMSVMIADFVSDPFLSNIWNSLNCFVHVVPLNILPATNLCFYFITFFIWLKKAMETF